MRNSLILLISFLLVSCSTLVKKEKKLFLEGTYFHKVSIDISKGPKFSFTGINRISDSKFNVVALSGMGNTLIDYQQDLRTKVETLSYDHNFFPIPKKRIENLVHLLHRMYSLTESICQQRTCNDEVYGFHFKFIRNELGLVEEINISRENTMTVNVIITKYKKNEEN
ncbi:hypothetical protein A9Q84_01210 [Halobacteriovorax marinus]|uniref:Lipoprotein n=1 Tax=Halobacteriovorax marinus TaxID=97084 RepID=A0A1Y5FBU8_9BACT|nr:hypothetical protein A9Q84_01210 [Halobacteriovorax marinus]